MTLDTDMASPVWMRSRFHLSPRVMLPDVAESVGGYARLRERLDCPHHVLGYCERKILALINRSL